MTDPHPDLRDFAVTCDDRDRVSDAGLIRHLQLIVELLSGSTEAFARGKKSAQVHTVT